VAGALARADGSGDGMGPAQDERTCRSQGGTIQTRSACSCGHAIAQFDALTQHNTFA